MASSSLSNRTVLPLSSFGIVIFVLVLQFPFTVLAKDNLPLTQEEFQILILRQFISLQKDLKELRKEVDEVKKSIARHSILSGQAREAAPFVPKEVKIQEDDSIIGNRGASIGILEFTDYQCPFCSRYHTETFPGLKSHFVTNGRVQYIVRNFPLGFHEHAKSAAVAAQCAGDQEKFWDMHDALFTHQKDLGEEMYSKIAQTLGLKMEEFSSCLKDPQKTQDVMDDLEYGTQIGVQGTPTFFIGRIQDGRLINPQLVTGAQPLDAYKKILDPLLK